MDSIDLYFIIIKLRNIFFFLYLSYFYFLISRQEKSNYELSDQDVSKLIIVTQTGSRKHDRGHKPNFPSYVMSQEMATTINDGLHYYEQDLRFQTDVSCI